MLIVNDFNQKKEVALFWQPLLYIAGPHPGLRFPKISQFGGTVKENPYPLLLRQGWDWNCMVRGDFFWKSRNLRELLNWEY